MTRDLENLVEVLARADPFVADGPVRMGIHDLLELVLPAFEAVWLHGIPPSEGRAFFEAERGLGGP